MAAARPRHARSSTLRVAALASLVFVLVIFPSPGQEGGAEDPAPALLAAAETQPVDHAARARELEAQAAAAPARAVYLLERAGWEYYDAGACAEALRVFAGMVERAPQYGNALDGLCVALYTEGALPSLQALLNRRLPPEERAAGAALVAAGIGATAGSVERDWGLGWLCARFGGANARGIEPLQRVLAALPEHAEARWRLADLYRRLGRKQEADAAAAEFAVQHPDTPEAYAVRAEQRASAADSLTEIDGGLARFPNATLLYTRGGMLAQRLADPAQAASALRSLLDRAEAARAATAALILRHQLADHSLARGQFAGAEAGYRQVLSDKSGPLDCEKLALACLAQGKYPEAAATYAEVALRHAQDVRSQPVQAQAARFRQAVCLLGTGDPAAADAAGAALSDALRIPLAVGDPHPVELQAFAAWAGVLDAQTGLSYRDGDERRLPILAGMQKRSEGKATLSSGAEAYRRLMQAVLQGHSGCYPAHYALAHSFTATGDAEAVLAHLQAARRASPQWWAPCWSLGLYYLDAKNRPAAKAELTAALRLAPGLREAALLLKQL